MAHSIGNEKEDKLIKELCADGHTLYSISRINSFNGCKYEYYNSYVKRDRGIQNIYSEVGSFVHNYIEEFYRGEIEDTSTFKRKLNTKMFKLEMQDMKFPNETIENSFRKDMEHFCDNFNKLPGKFTLEKAYVAKFDEYYLMGYIDAIQEVDDKINILDWKSSSKFVAKKLEHAGRQLITYKLGLEQSGLKIDNVMWNMLKYCYICNVQKNKKVKRKMVNRGKIFKEMGDKFKDIMLDNMSEIEADILLSDLAKDNNFDGLPREVKDVYWLEDCLLEYEATDERIEEVQNYIINSIKEIESMDFEDENAWHPHDIDKENFYCNTLCGQRETCKHLKEWKRKNPFKKIGF